MAGLILSLRLGVVLGAVLITTRPAEADGTLPPAQYHYLHPPAAVAASNVQPTSGTRSLPAAFMRGSSWFHFTSDGQAGLVARPGAIRPPSGVQRVVLTIAPVATPPGLPSSVMVDGNAYRFSITGMPGAVPLTLAHQVILTFVWPRFPTGIYIYRAGGWKQLCSLAQAIRTSSTISCAATAMGTFAVVTRALPGAKTAPGQGSGTAGSSSGLARVLLGAGLGVLALVIGTLLWLLRRRRAGSPARQ